MRDTLNLSPEDLDTVVRTVIGEAAGEGRTGMEAVASVIKNRAEDVRGAWPDTAAGVSRQPAQFSTWNSPRNGGNSIGRSASRNSDVYRQAEAAVLGVFSGKTADPTRGATHYYAPGGMPGGRAPGWWSGVTKERSPVSIGGHRVAGQVQRGNQSRSQATAFAPSQTQRGATAAIGGLLAGPPQNVPTPTSAPRGLLAGNVPTPASARMSAPANPAMPQASLDRYASTRPTPNSPVVSAPAPAREARALSRAQEENLAGRLGPVEAPRSATTIGGLLGVTPAAAATMTPELARAHQQAQTAAAPPSRQSPSIGSPRALEAMGAPPLDPVAQALAPLPARDVPTRQVASIPGPVGMSAPSSRPTGPMGPNVGYTPDRPVSRSAASGGAGGYATSLPNAPAAPTQGLLSGLQGWASNNRGMVTGGLLGGTLAGPIGMIAGGLLGRAFQTPEIGGGEASPSAAAQAALNAGWGGFGPMTAAQERAAYSAMGGSSRDNAPSQAAQDAARGGKAGGLF